MAFNMKNRSLLSLVHHTQRELHYLLDLSRDLKRAKYTGTEEPHLKGKNIALIFEKPRPAPVARLKWQLTIRAHTSPTSTRCLRKSATKKA